MLQFASPSFDASVAELVVSLVQGASLHLVEARQLLPGGGLEGVLREHAITVVTLPPSVLGIVEDLAGVETVISAGEACRGELVRRWQPGRVFWNAYGPTEITVCASVERCEAQALGGWGPGIGHGFGEMEVYVVDRRGQVQPIGVAGEL